MLDIEVIPFPKVEVYNLRTDKDDDSIVNANPPNLTDIEVLTADISMMNSPKMSEYNLNVISALHLLDNMGYQDPKEKFKEYWNITKPDTIIKVNFSTTKAKNEEIDKSEKQSELKVLDDRLSSEIYNKNVIKLMKAFKYISELKGYFVLERDHKNLWKGIHIQEVKPLEKPAFYDIKDSVDNFDAKKKVVLKD